VPKRVGLDGEQKWRLVVDFRRPNEKNDKGCSYLTEILDQFGQSNYFTLLDMVMEYHQIELEEGEGPNTDLSTKHGH